MRVRITILAVTAVVVAALLVFVPREKPVYEPTIAPEPQFSVMTAEISAYTSSVDETDDTPFLTAAQTRTREGVVACPGWMEFGTIVGIEGQLYACEDRMAKKYRDGNYFDIWMETKAEAFEWGRRTLEIKVYEETEVESKSLDSNCVADLTEHVNENIIGWLPVDNTTGVWIYLVNSLGCAEAVAGYQGDTHFVIFKRNATSSINVMHEVNHAAHFALMAGSETYLGDHTDHAQHHEFVYAQSELYGWTMELLERQ